MLSLLVLVDYQLFVDYSGFSCHPQKKKKDNFISFFLIWMAFISLCCLIALAGTYSIMLNNCDESGYLCTVHNIWDKISVFHHCGHVSCRFFINILYHVKEIQLLSYFVSVFVYMFHYLFFIIKMLDFVKYFCANWEYNFLKNFLHSSMWYITLIFFLNVKLPLHYWDKPH